MPLVNIARSLWRLAPPFIKKSALQALIWGVPQAKNLRPGTNAPVFIVGLFQSATGLGHGARIYYNEIKSAGQPVYAIDMTADMGIDVKADMFAPPVYTPASCPHLGHAGRVVIHLNPPHFVKALRLLRGFLANKRIESYWAWELERIPSFWLPACAFVDEIMVPSFFTAQALRSSTIKPVTVHPYNLPPLKARERKFAEDGTVRLLFIFDMKSNFYRKNPLAVIRAFKLAFGDSEKFQLTLKTSAFKKRQQKEFALLEREIADAANITLNQQALSPRQMAELYGASDIYLSLHRSEGYGLTIREAMMYGLEVVATGWSGNMDFMHGPQCHAVPFRLIAVDDPSHNFSAHGGLRWADADIKAAAGILRKIVNKHQQDTLC